MGRSFRTLIFAVLASVGVLGTLLAGGVLYWITSDQLRSNLDAQLQQSTDSLYHLVDTAARVAIRSRLRSVAEWNRDQIRYHLEQAEHTDRSRDQVIADARQLLLRQRIGETGYLYCVDSNGFVPVHPNTQVEGTDATRFAFVRRQAEQKVGYLEYAWQNPGEPEPRLKALYMCYLAELDWIITASAYRNEARSLIDEADFRERILTVDLPGGGYPFVVGYDSTVIVHPYVDGERSMSADLPELYRQIMTKESGTVGYQWANPHESEPRRKIGVFRHIPDLEWVVISAVYPHEIYRPLAHLRWMTGLGLVVVVGIAFVIAAFLSRSLSRPLGRLLHAMTEDPGSLSQEPLRGPKEFRILTGTFNDYVQRQRLADAEIERSHRMLQLVLDTIPVGVFWKDVHRSYLGANNRFVQDMGFADGATLAGCRDEELPWADGIVPAATVEQRILNDGVVSLGLEERHRLADGEDHILRISRVPLRQADGEIIGMLGIYEDISAHKDLEERLHRSQRMDAIGQLAAGIAHDFNNALTAVMGAAELLKRYANDDRSRTLTGNILDASTHAAELTGKLLAFARTGTRLTAPVDVHAVIGQVLELLRRTIDPRIVLQSRLQAPRCIVHGDNSLLQSALLNLGINARDAMPDGGTLEYRSELENLDADRCRQIATGLSPGPHLRIEVSDTGVGMTKAVLDRIFEPFFTTKQEGKGSGLGLAAVFGTISEHRGGLEVESEPDVGSCFRIYLPLVTGTAMTRKLETHNGIAFCGRVLLVDDDDIVRDTAAVLIEALGCTVVTASGGHEAMACYEQWGSAIDLVLLDMLMPERNGPEVMQDLRRAGLHAPVLLISGYAVQGAVSNALVQGADGFLRKPFRLQELAEAIARVANTKRPL